MGSRSQLHDGVTPVLRVKRYAVTIAGFGVLAIGAALLVLPGPGLLLIVVGLAILATEYVWAHRLMAVSYTHLTLPTTPYV